MLKRRLTKQRLLVLDLLRDSDKHLSAEEVYDVLKADNPELSLGTVYRNLNVLEEQGEVLKVEGNFPSSKYDGNTKPHHHFHCEVCDEIFDVEMNYCGVFVREYEECSGNKVSECNVLFTGICKSCKNNMN